MFGIVELELQLRVKFGSFVLASPEFSPVGHLCFVGAFECVSFRLGRESKVS